ncbi:class I SAM-dependent methyltransferase [Arthrobacter sp. NPDC090010]|uniref:class I SAM-dependent methyltransferase n=1 Tax=Arthrobacter sp. NPDC090010 TaxID=3363942 RepID=UPI0037F6B101
MIDKSLSNPALSSYRSTVCSGLYGQVVELGFGSGLNIGHYPPAVERVAAIEPSDTAWELSAGRRDSSPVPIERQGRDAQSLPCGDGSVDAILSTFTLCTIPDPVAALREVRRVLRRGGTFAFLEHGRSPDRAVAGWQKVIGPLNTRFAGGCHLGRQIDRLIADAGLTLVTGDAGYLDVSAPKSQRYGFVGTARKDG